MSVSLQTLATQVQSMATQVESFAHSFRSIREETSELRRLAMSRQENLTTATHVGTSAHFSKPARFGGKDLTSLVGRSWTPTRTALARTISKSTGSGHTIDKAFDWHMAEVRYYDLDAPTAWTSYSKALKARFTDSGADAKNYQRMLKLKYEGDTHDYPTQFMKLNTSGQALGFGERSAIRRALPDKVVDTMNVWRKGRILTDNDFIDQLKVAGANHEEDLATAAAAQPTPAPL
ncbi:hypothetical protein E4U13_005150 [Claviceps humidiphila]|uniref:Uncharacterized protein n=1 Tax=Claviceps humidiphila TaxID=1294629 RepID=A0A9P7TX79_9HYPO|nr:hypothetical protein E4U13_005150 [Claviceps humidiphila]